jgi:hypothetical protein
MLIPEEYNRKLDATKPIHKHNTPTSQCKTLLKNNKKYVKYVVTQQRKTHGYTET